jgi:hypothetical protein
MLTAWITDWRDIRGNILFLSVLGEKRGQVQFIYWNKEPGQENGDKKTGTGSAIIVMNTEVFNMFRISIVRIAILMIYFTLCSACGKPHDTVAKKAAEQPSSTTASDINFIGGGNQVPTPVGATEPGSGTQGASTSALTWAPDVDMAVSIAGGNRDYKIVVWFTNPDCDDCVKIEQTLFSDPDVIKASAHRLWVRMDTSVSKNQSEYYLHGAEPPALVFLDTSGREFRHYYGSFTKEDLVGMLTTWI